MPGLQDYVNARPLLGYLVAVVMFLAAIGAIVPWGMAYWDGFASRKRREGEISHVVLYTFFG